MTRPPYGPGPGGPMPPHVPPRTPVAPPPYPMPMRPPTQYPQPYPQQMPPPQVPAWHGTPPYRPKSNTGRTVTITLVAVLLVAGGLAGVLALTSNKSTTSVTDEGYQNSNTTPTVQPPSSYQYPSSAAVPPTATATPATPAGPQPVFTTANNPFFQGENSANTVTCNLPPWRSEQKAAEAFFNAAIPCLEQAWQPTLQRANLPYVRPKVAYPTGKEWKSGCGEVSQDENVSAFYCTSDETLYVPLAGLNTARNGGKIGVYLQVFSHEFSHHVQAMTGSLRAAYKEMHEKGANTDAGMEMSRRIELQAQCMAGMWFAAARNGKGSITDQVVQDAITTSYERGDGAPDQPRDHGTKAHYGSWLKQGYEENRTFQCNTYKSPADHIS